MASFVIGDYTYTTSDNNTVRVEVTDKTKATYQDIPSSVMYQGMEYSVTSTLGCFGGCTSLTTAPVIPNSVTSMASCFNNCWSLTTVPVIPHSVTSMRYCFQNCTSLITAPVIPDSVRNIEGCFYGCTSLTTAPVIHNRVTSIDNCFRNCTSLTGDIYVYSTSLGVPRWLFNGTTQPITLHSMNNNTGICQQLAQTATNNNVYVNIHPETPITFIDTEMNYKTDSGFTPVSLQTNATLVQCEVPDLVNGGTITTNVNDALLDWLVRTKTPKSTYYFDNGDVVNGVTISWETTTGDINNVKIQGRTTSGVDMILYQGEALFDGEYYCRGYRRGASSNPFSNYYRINGGAWQMIDTVTNTFSLQKGDVVEIRVTILSDNYISQRAEVGLFADIE